MGFSMSEQAAWNATEIHKAFRAADAALFELHHLMDALEPGSGWWRQVYGMRCDLGQLQQHMQFRLAAVSEHQTENPRKPS